MGSSSITFTNASTAGTWSREVRAGRARRIARGLYTTDLVTDPAKLVRDHFVQVTGHFFPGALIADRSVPLMRPDEGGFLFVIHPRTRPLELPGLVIVPRTGHGPLADDLPFAHGLFVCSRPRALVENLRPSRSVKGRPPRTLTTEELHEWVMRLLRVEGVARLNEFRDRAKEIAEALGLQEEFAHLDQIIGAAQGTREVETSHAGLAAAQVGRPFDETREAKFDALARLLRERAPLPRPLLPGDVARRRFLPFFEAYFSNFIEGTEFSLDEARDIVFSGAIPAERPEDAHDILETWRVVSDEAEMRRRPASLDDLIDLLKSRHARVMGARPEKGPGQLKTRANRAGGTEFVAPHLVVGTLARGMQRLAQLDDPFARAVMVMFIVSEVHPFADGNGRLARIMMNAELQSADEHRIIIPTVFRGEYLSGLRALTHNVRAEALVRVLDFAQRYTVQLDLSTYEGARQQLEATHAFVDPNEAVERGLRLTLPSALEW